METKSLQNTKPHGMVLVLLLILVVFNIPSVIFSLAGDSLRIPCTGSVSMTNILATSGSAADIQAAVDSVIASGGIGNVFIPEGIFNFVEVDQPWMAVHIPAGISIFGAPTERDDNGQVTEWKTVLVMPYDVPGTWESMPWWFYIAGTGDPHKPSRFSDIEMVGYRSIDPSSTTMSLGIRIMQVVNFRIDHVHMEHIAGRAIGIYASEYSMRSQCNGVIDHCVFENPVGVAPVSYAAGSVGYGIDTRPYLYDFPDLPDGTDMWELDVSKVLGQYTPVTVFIEDNYFSGWRHCVSGNSGSHYVFRYNHIENDYGPGHLDAHGWGNWDGTKVDQVGTRAMEIYGNLIDDPAGVSQGYWDILFRGGSGIVWNNTQNKPAYSFVYMANEADAEVSMCFSKDIWIWDNTILSGVPLYTATLGQGGYVPQLDVDFFLHAPHTFNWQPYPYPHPLTLLPET